MKLECRCFSNNQLGSGYFCLIGKKNIVVQKHAHSSRKQITYILLLVEKLIRKTGLALSIDLGHLNAKSKKYIAYSVYKKLISDLRNLIAIND